MSNYYTDNTVRCSFCDEIIIGLGTIGKENKPRCSDCAKIRTVEPDWFSEAVATIGKRRKAAL